MAIMAEFCWTRLVSKPEQKHSQERTVQDGCDGQASFEHRSHMARDQAHQKQNHAPGHRGPPRDAEKMRVGPMPDCAGA